MDPTPPVAVDVALNGAFLQTAVATTLPWLIISKPTYICPAAVALEKCQRVR